MHNIIFIAQDQLFFTSEKGFVKQILGNVEYVYTNGQDACCVRLIIKTRIHTARFLTSGIMQTGELIMH